MKIIENDPTTPDFVMFQNDGGFLPRKVIQKSNHLDLTKIISSIKDEWRYKKRIYLENEEGFTQFLHIYNKAVENELGFPLRDAQRVAITALLRNQTIVKDRDFNKILIEVQTGEGKSLIVAGVVIALVLSGTGRNGKIDVRASRTRFHTVVERGRTEKFLISST